MKKVLLFFIYAVLALAPLSAAPTPDDDSNHTISYEGETISGAGDITGGHGSETANNNRVIIQSSTIEGSSSPLFNTHIIGGWAVNNQANGNTVEITDSTVNRNITGGQATFGTQANHNTVSITGSKVNEGAPLQEVTTLSRYQVEHRLDDQGQDEYVLSSMASQTVKTAGDLTPEFSAFTTYGGVVAHGEAAYNTITVTDSNGPIGNNLIAGYSPYLAETTLHHNSVNVVRSQVQGLIVGAASLGAAYDTTVKTPLLNNNNSVLLQSSQVNDVIGAYGGFSTNGNSIVLLNSSADNLYGVSFGQNIFYSGDQPTAIENTAYNNSVALYNHSVVNGDIYGAQSHSVQARGNRVTISGGSEAKGSIFGANVFNALVQEDDNTISWNPVQTAAENNIVTISGSTAGSATAEIAGAQNLSGWAYQNAVEISDSSVTAETLAGGWAEHEKQTLTDSGEHLFSIGYQANQNSVTSQGSQLDANVYGGRVSFVDDVNPSGTADLTPASASGNFVHLDETSVTGNIYGGSAEGEISSANNNFVWLTHAQVAGDVYGGQAIGTQSSSLRNEVILQDTSVSGDIYASSAAQSGNNTVTLAGKTYVGGTIYGGNGGNSQLTLLNFQSTNPLQLNGFDRPYLISGANTSVTFAQTVDRAEVYVQGIEDVNGHVMIRTPDDTSLFTLHSVDSGVYTYTLSPENQTDGWTNWVLSGGFSAPRGESYAQTAMAALALANAGDSLLTDAVAQAASSAQETGTFLQSGYENAEHQTGSGLRLHATTVLGGLYAKKDALLGGFYARYSYGDYTTFPVHSQSDATSWAGGLFGAWQAAERLQLSADMRVGWQKTGYGGSYETRADFDYEGVFTSLQTAARYTLHPDLAAQARLRWTHLTGDSLTDNLGEQIYLAGSDSLLGTLGLTWTARALAFGQFTPQVGAELLHEFNGQGKAVIESHRLDGLSLRGTTGRFTAGLTYENVPHTLYAALSAFAEDGQTEGWGVRLDGRLRF